MYKNATESELRNQMQDCEDEIKKLNDLKSEQLMKLGLLRKELNRREHCE